jgi:hypothetical protein
MNAVSWIKDRVYSWGITRTLFIGLCGGGVCVLLDIDHPIAWSLGFETRRIFHPAYLGIACGIICGIIAYIGGLFFKEVLRRKYG